MARKPPRSIPSRADAQDGEDDVGRRECESANVGEAFLKKGPPPHPLSKTFREEYGRVSPKRFSHFAVRRNFTPQVFHLPLAANFTRRRRISLCNRMAVAPGGTATRWMRCATSKEAAGGASPSPTIILNYRRISPYPKTTFHFAVRRNFTPQVFHLPLAANITRRRRISLCNRPRQLHFVPLQKSGGRNVVYDKQHLSRPAIENIGLPP